MLSRKLIATAYQCHVNTLRPILHEVGIDHLKQISLEEFKKVVKKLGYPIDKNYQYLADQAMQGEITMPVQLSLFPGVRSIEDHLHIFPGIKNTRKS